MALDNPYGVSQNFDLDDILRPILPRTLEDALKEWGIKCDHQCDNCKWQRTQEETAGFLDRLRKGQEEHDKFMADSEDIIRRVESNRTAQDKALIDEMRQWSSGLRTVPDLYRYKPKTEAQKAEDEIRDKAAQDRDFEEKNPNNTIGNVYKYSRKNSRKK